MNFTRPTNAVQQQKQTQKRPRRSWFMRLFRFLCYLVIGVCALLLAAPMLLSTDVGRRTVLKCINATIAPARLDVEDWSLAWFSEQRLSNVSYHDEKGQLQVDVAQIRTSSLWALLPLGHISADMTIESPVLTMTPSEAKEEVPPLPQPEKVSEVGEPFALPDLDLSLQVVIVDATIRHKDYPKPLLYKGRLELSAPAFDQDITAKVSASFLDGDLKSAIRLLSPRAISSTDTPYHTLKHAEADFQAPWGTLQTKANAVPNLPYPELTLRSTITPAKLLPHLQDFGLALEDVEFTSGSVDAEISLLRGLTPDTMLFDTNIRSETFHCKYKEEKLELFATISAGATLYPETLSESVLSRFTVKLPGVEAEGAGSLTDGRLQASFDVGRLCHHLRPFTDGAMPAAPLQINLSAKGTNGDLKATVTASSDKTAVGKATVDICGLDLEKRQLQTAELTSLLHLEPLKPFLACDDFTTFKGNASFSLKGLGGMDAFTCTADLRLEDVEWATEQWLIREKKFLLAGGEIKYLADAPLQLNALRVVIGRSMLSGQAQLDPSKPLATSLTATLSGSIVPGYPLKHWKVWGEKATPTTLDGEVKVELSAQPNPTGSTLPLLTVLAHSEELKATLPDYPPIETPFRLAFTAKEADDETFLLSDFNAETSYIQVQKTQGAYSSAGVLDLKGDLTMDLEALWGLPFLEDARDSGFAVTGLSTQPFTFSAPLTYGPEGIINYGKGKAAINFDRITVPGLDIPKGMAALDFTEGVATLKLTATINDGDLHLNPSINLATHPYILTLPKNSQVLSNMRVTQQMLDDGLYILNPLLPGAAQPSGTIDLFCSDFQMVLDDEPLASLESALQLRTHELQLRANDLLTSALILLKKPTATTLEDQAFNIRVADGILTTDPIHMRVDDLRLSCAGSTNLVTKALDYTLSVPLTDELLGRKVSTYVKSGDTLQLPIQGIVGKPRMDLSPIRDLVLQRAQQAARAEAVERLEERKKQSSNKRTQAALGIVQGLLQEDESGENVLDAALQQLFQ